MHENVFLQETFWYGSWKGGKSRSKGPGWKSVSFGATEIGKHGDKADSSNGKLNKASLLWVVYEFCDEAKKHWCERVGWMGR